MKKSTRFVLILAGIIVGFSSLVVGIYLKAIPMIVQNPNLHSFIQKEVKKSFGADLKIEDVTLKTGKNLDFGLKQIVLTKNEQELLRLENLDTSFSVSQILSKRLIVNKIYADNIYVNTSGLMELLPEQEQKEQKELPLNIDIFSAFLGVKKCLITYNFEDTDIKFDADNLILDRTQEKKFLHFDFLFELNKSGDKILISADDRNCIYMGNGELHVDNFPLEIDKSKLIINAFASRKKGLELNISSKKFSAKDIYSIITSNIIIPNGKELLSPIRDVKGSVDFQLHLTKKNIDGSIDVNESEFKIKDLLDMPVKITQGFIDIGNSSIVLKDFLGFYNNRTENSIKLKGEIKDYLKTCDTKIVSDIFINDDFFRDYLTKMLGSPINLVGDAGSRMTLTSKNGSCDIVWYFLLKENEGFMLGEQSMVLKNYKTLFKLDMSVVKNILKINTIDYFITNELKKGMTPVLSFNGNFDMADNMRLLDIKLNIPRPLPSEFLNFLCGQKIFKKGTISGNLSVDNNGSVPKMDGVIEFSEVRIPSQRLFIKSAKIGAKDDKLGAIANGKYKRSNYDFKGYIVNELKLPIVVKNVSLNLDNVDVERMLTSTNETTAENTLSYDEKTSENEDSFTFTKDLIIVENCDFNLEKGKYKEVDFGNLHANLTLDKDGVLEIKSNKFDIAEGISTLKVKADLIKKDYYLRLGIKDVNSDVMASAILGLPREISGKAKGLIELNSDEKLKLNGSIKFAIDDGSIEKIGYVEYILKVAALFRNPAAMITPATFGDLVNIPDGKFDKINGEMTLKDNVITKMMIKSSAEQLSSFIVGRYNLENNDATLRIYTKMSNKGKGFAGVLRNISLNSLANKISASGRNDSNYYAAELSHIPDIKADEKDCQVFLTTVDGDIVNFNFLSSLKRIK